MFSRISDNVPAFTIPHWLKVRRTCRDAVSQCRVFARIHFLEIPLATKGLGEARRLNALLSDALAFSEYTYSLSSSIFLIFITLVCAGKDASISLSSQTST